MSQPNSKARSSRREFLKKSSVAAAAGAAVPYFAWSQPAFANKSPNDRPVIGCIGLGGMGTGDAHEHAHFGDIVAVCDVDSKRADAAKHDKDIGKGKADALWRLPQSARRQRYRRGERRHARPLACENRASRRSKPASMCFRKSRSR